MIRFNQLPAVLFTMSVVSITVFSLSAAQSTSQTAGNAGTFNRSDADENCAVRQALPVQEIPSGEFQMGSNSGYPDERPVRRVEVNSFCIMRHEVTNAQFARFVDATGYVTQSERSPDPSLHPEIPEADLVAGSAVFVPPTSRDQYWWHFVPGATWRTPEGPGSGLTDRWQHPVVHIAYEDAIAFADWAGGRLPSESEWEYAARGGLEGSTYEWGETPPSQGSARANTWQGAFPIVDIGSDGYVGTAPVGQYEPNGFGLYDMTGNVWEWVSEANRARNSGLLKGGSFLCADNFCRRYRPSAKHAQELDFSSNHIGFRIVFDLSAKSESAD